MVVLSDGPVKQALELLLLNTSKLYKNLNEIEQNQVSLNTSCQGFGHLLFSSFLKLARLPLPVACKGMALPLPVAPVFEASSSVLAAVTSGGLAVRSEEGFPDGEARALREFVSALKRSSWAPYAAWLFVCVAIHCVRVHPHS